MELWTKKVPHESNYHTMTCDTAWGA